MSVSSAFTSFYDIQELLDGGHEALKSQESGMGSNPVSVRCTFYISICQTKGPQSF
jgi:hypothetical protein